MKTSVVVPTLNGLEDLKNCLASLRRQTTECTIIVVTNGTTDGTQRFISLNYPEVIVLSYPRPLGFAGAVNAGIRYSIEHGFRRIALLNNDAVAARDWLARVSERMDLNPSCGVVTSKIKSVEENRLDSTGDYYTNWFLPYPRGRGKRDRGQYETPEKIVAASGGASLFKSETFQNIGLFDEAFFAYYEDVDVGLRAQHAGIEVWYEPQAVVTHKIGATSSRIKGFTTAQTMKNLPLVVIKNVPFRLILKYGWKFWLAYTLFALRACTRWQGHYALKGWLKSIYYTPHALVERRRIMKFSKLSTEEFDKILVHDLPPNAKHLRRLRSLLRRKK
jgi:GT2 family glycosyltransferase